jgi:hypothetical protein
MVKPLVALLMYMRRVHSLARQPTSYICLDCEIERDALAILKTRVGSKKESKLNIKAMKCTWDNI